MRKFSDAELELAPKVAEVMGHYKHKSWLYRKYWIEKMSGPEIAGLCGVHSHTIVHWLHKHGIRVRGASESLVNYFAKYPDRHPRRRAPMTNAEKKEFVDRMQAWRRDNPGAMSGENGANWRGGQRTTHQGYILIYAPDHPNCGTRKAVPEHRLIVEGAIGRYLKKGEVVHHLNGDKADNRPENLLLCTVSFHHWLHLKMADLYMKEHFGGKDANI